MYNELKLYNKLEGRKTLKKQKNYPYYNVVPFDSIYELISTAATESADNIAFRYKTGHNSEITDISYKHFFRDIMSLGAALSEKELDKKHIACIGDNSYEWLTVYLTGLVSDGVFVPLDKELPDADILNVVLHSDSEVIFCSSKYEKLFMSNADKLPMIKAFICFDREEDEGIFLSYNKFLNHGIDLYEKGNKFCTAHEDTKKLKMIVYTSGTTGMAKGVMLSEFNLVSSVYHGLRVSTVYDTCLSVLPYNHTYEAVCGTLVGLHMRGTCCINESLKTVASNLQLYKPSYVLLVPAFAENFYAKIMKNISSTGKEKSFNMAVKLSGFLRNIGIDLRKKLFADIHKVFGGRMIKIVCGGAPIRPEIGKFFDDIGITLINGYGITECSPLVSCNRDYYNDPSTVGVKLPCLDIRLDDINEDDNGEIMVKGDVVMLGYYKNEEETNKVMKDGWFATGDFGKINDEGQLTITGRKKNLIVLNNGKNIYPEEIENYIISIPQVKDVIVYAPKDGNEEKHLSAEVYLEEEMSLDELHSEIKAKLAELPSYKQIRDVIIREEEFEKTTSNKIKRAKYN